MILVIGLWTFLRAIVTDSAALALEKHGAAPSTHHPPAVRPPTTPGAAGSDLLGLAVPRLDQLAIQSPARHRGGMAPPRLPALLSMEVQSEPGRPPEARRRDSPSDPTHGSEPSDRGPTAHLGLTRSLIVCASSTRP